MQRGRKFRSETAARLAIQRIREILARSRKAKSRLLWGHQISRSTHTPTKTPAERDSNRPPRKFFGRVGPIELDAAAPSSLAPESPRQTPRQGLARNRYRSVYRNTQESSLRHWFLASGGRGSPRSPTNYRPQTGCLCTELPICSLVVPHSRSNTPITCRARAKGSPRVIRGRRQQARAAGVPCPPRQTPRLDQGIAMRRPVRIRTPPLLRSVGRREASLLPERSARVLRGLRKSRP